MNQVLQHLNSGKTELTQVPAPRCRAGHLLIASHASLISAGTERMLVEFSQGNLIEKARSQPERVRQVMDKVKTDGLMPTVESVRNKLDQPLPMGYCNAGTVLEVGAGVVGFSIGDRVVSNGPHAEIITVPQNLCARIPDGVDNDSAAFTVLGSVALQGVRLINPTLGERIAVIGLGLVGLMTVQILVANGCEVLGIDFSADRLELARQFGASTVDLSKGEDPVAAGMTFSRGHGIDGVLITASTSSNDPVRQAAQMSRKRGRIVLVGVTGLALDRADFFEKELTFQVSCSYGPGRYDPLYEEKGQDYPIGFVRWTEQRNFEAILGLMASNKLDVSSLISERVQHDNAPAAYDALTDNKAALGILLQYKNGHAPDLRSRIQIESGKPTSFERTAGGDGTAVVGVIGAGNFAMGVLLPALKKTKARTKLVVSSGGTSAAIAAKKFGFQEAASDVAEILNDSEINTVLITTRHNTHAKLVVDALDAGKHVFVEKPLALNQDELAEVKSAVNRNPDRQLLVGFNRRFSPLTEKMKELLSSRTEPVSLIYTVNAGSLPADHWTLDPQIGGGRIIGEACHFVDLLSYVVGSSITGLCAQMIGGETEPTLREDKMTLTLSFEDGSIGTIHYFANGHRSFTKERIEAFSEQRILMLDNFRSLQGYGWSDFKKKKLRRQDKGHSAELTQFVNSISQGEEWLIPWDSLEETCNTDTYFSALALISIFFHTQTLLRSCSPII